MAENEADTEALLASMDQGEINQTVEMSDFAIIEPSTEVLTSVTPPTRTYFPRKKNITRQMPSGASFIPTSQPINTSIPKRPSQVKITPLPIRQSTVNAESGTMTVEIPQSLVRKYDPALGGKIVYYKDVKAVDEYVGPLKHDHEIDVLNINKGTVSESYIVMIKPKSVEEGGGDSEQPQSKCPICKRDNIKTYVPDNPTVEHILNIWLNDCNLEGKPGDLCADCGDYIVPTLIENHQHVGQMIQNSDTVVSSNEVNKLQHLTELMQQQQQQRHQSQPAVNTRPNKCLGCARNVFVDEDTRSQLLVLPAEVENFSGNMERLVTRRLWLALYKGHIMAPTTQGMLCESCDMKSVEFFNDLKHKRSSLKPGAKRARIMDDTEPEIDEDDSEQVLERMIYLSSRSIEELKSTDSVFTKTDEENLSQLSAEHFHDELEKQAPLLHALIKGLVSTNSNCKKEAEVSVASTLLYSNSFKLNAWQIRNTLIYNKNNTPPTVMKMLNRERQVVPKSVLEKLEYSEAFLSQLNCRDSEPRYLQATQKTDAAEGENPKTKSDEEGEEEEERVVPKQGPPPLTQVQCPHCPFIPAARSVFGLQRHIEQNHATDDSRNCNQCNYRFENRKKQAAHLLYHELVSYKCESCLLGFESEKQWREHQQYRCPTTANSLMCAICEYPERTVKGLHEHQRAHGPSEIYKVPCYCTFCHAPFRNIWTLGKHMEDVHANKLIPCPHCEEKCDNWYLMRDHLYMVHRKRYRTNPFPFQGVGEKCTYCTQRFADEGDYSAHKVNHEADGWYLCVTCDAVFWNGKPSGHKCLSDPTRASFKCDSKKLPPTEIRYTCLSDGSNSIKYRCNNCRFEAVTKALMEKHSVTHYGYNAREIYCMACFAPFPTKPSLYKHLVRVHKFDKAEIAAMRAKGKSQPHMLQCKHCDAFFKSSAAMTAHMSSVHPKPNEEDDSLKIYACNHCDRRCRSFKGLHEHQRMKHGIEALSPHPDPKINRQLYACKHCDKMCISKKGLLEHMRLKHDTFEEPVEEQDPGLFPYQCNQCDKRCKTPRGLKHHLRAHTNELARKAWPGHPVEELDPDMYPHKCTQCDKRCKTPKGLNEHIKLTHQRAERIRSMLQSNVQVHYKCSACNKLFISKTACIRHKEMCSKMAQNTVPMTHQTITEQTPKYQCANCNETFFDWAAVQRHVQICGQTLTVQDEAPQSQTEITQDVVTSHVGETIVAEDVSALEILQQVMEGQNTA